MYNCKSLLQVALPTADSGTERKLPLLQDHLECFCLELYFIGNEYKAQLYQNKMSDFVGHAFNIAETFITQKN